MNPLLEVINIKKRYNSIHILEDITFSLCNRIICCLFGENGAGKSTLFNIITGFISPNDGQISFRNSNITHESPMEISKLGIGRVWQTPRICQNLSVKDNLILAKRRHPGEIIKYYFTRPYYICQQEKEANVLAETVSFKVGLSSKYLNAAGSLSFGQQKLLSIGMLLMNEAELLLIDEPFAGLNYKMIEQISEVLLYLKAQDKSVLIIEHNRVKAKEICDNVFFLIKGKIHNG
jgi:ABC-type branched-subunit amino acid transport system ATPase component